MTRARDRALHNSEAFKARNCRGGAEEELQLNSNATTARDRARERGIDMVVFTSTEPGFMTSAGSAPFAERKNPKVNDFEGRKWKSVYLHGAAEDFVGYDIPVLVDGLLNYQPEQDVQVVAAEGKTIDCILVAWTCKSIYMGDPEGTEHIRGLICAKTDQPSLDYARKCQAERVTSL